MPCDTACCITTIDAHDETASGTASMRGHGDVLYFLKNSDRNASEPQLLERYPRKSYGPKDCGVVRTTYIAIPQVAHTHSILISRPAHIWGAEMGVNEFGLCVGNEALFAAAVPVRRTNDCLIGMDLVRLVLERCRTVQEAMVLVPTLLQEHHLGGNCGPSQAAPFYYHNGLVVTDRHGGVVTMVLLGQAWLLIERQRSEAHAKSSSSSSQSTTVPPLIVTMSNTLSSVCLDGSCRVSMSVGMASLLNGGGGDACDAAAAAVSSLPCGVALDSAAPWCRRTDQTPPTWTDTRIQHLIGPLWAYHRLCDIFGRGGVRARCLHQQLQALTERCGGGATDSGAARDCMVLGCFDALRTHSDDNDTVSDAEVWWGQHALSTICKFFLRNDVCMHAGCGPVRQSGTTNSLVVEVTLIAAASTTTAGAEDCGLFEGVRAWSTVASNPCITPFKPITLLLHATTTANGDACESGRVEVAAADVRRWWRVEAFHRMMMPHRGMWGLLCGAHALPTGMQRVHDWVARQERRYLNDPHPEENQHYREEAHYAAHGNSDGVASSMDASVVSSTIVRDEDRFYSSWATDYDRLGEGRPLWLTAALWAVAPLRMAYAWHTRRQLVLLRRNRVGN